MSHYSDPLYYPRLLNSRPFTWQAWVAWPCCGVPALVGPTCLRNEVRPAVLLFYVWDAGSKRLLGVQDVWYLKVFVRLQAC